MSAELRDVSVIGIHPTTAEFEEAIETLWGSGLSEAELVRARENVREHFDGLFLVEVRVEPSDAAIDWAQMTQAVHDQDAENWQVAYDERPVVGTDGRWAFFLHCVDLKRPLSTPVGDRPLPEPTALPTHLASIRYEMP